MFVPARPILTKKCLITNMCIMSFSFCKRSHTAEHCWKYNHDIDWEHKKVLDFEKNWKTRTIKEASYSEENEHHINGISFKLQNIWKPILWESKAKKTTAKTTTSSNWVHKGPPISIAPNKSAIKVSQSEATLKYFDPPRTHKYHTHTHTICLMKEEVTLEMSLKNIMTQDMIHSKNSMEINEMYSNCWESYRPVIIGFVQCQHFSVQLVLRKWIGVPRYYSFWSNSDTLVAQDLFSLTSPRNWHCFPESNFQMSKKTQNKVTRNSFLRNQNKQICVEVEKKIYKMYKIVWVFPMSQIILILVITWLRVQLRINCKGRIWKC